MALNYLAGAENFIALSTSTISSAASEDANFPAANLGVKLPGKPFKFAAAGLNDSFKVDLGSAKSVDLSGLHGHNIDSGITVKVRASTDNFAASNDEIATLTKASPTFYGTFSSVSYRYWAIQFSGTNGTPIEIGEWTLGLKSTLTRTQLAGWSYREVMPQNRQTGGNVPQAFAANITTHRQRVVDLEFNARTIAARDEIRDLFTDTNFGEEPLIFIPDSNDEIIIHGRLPSSFEWQRGAGGTDGFGYHRTQFAVVEDPFAMFLPS